MTYPLNLPPLHLSTIFCDGLTKVFDTLRKKYVALTPEEMVRQHFVAWMVNQLHYPSSLMANEISITLNNTQKRCDTVVFEKSGKPLMIVEYKAPDIKISQAVFDQIARYNMVLDARFLVVSNGLSHYCCEMDYENASYRFLSTVPDYLELKQSSHLNTSIPKP